MAHYIDKDAVVAEIESKKEYAQTLGDNAINSSMQQFYDGMKQGCVNILSFINSLEVKEVDLEKALSDLDKDIKEFVTTEEFENESATAGHYWAIAKHAFLLGLKAQKDKT
jgi:hypothetical protein